MVQRAATPALVVLSVSSLIQQAAFAASERTTALVTIAEANARCLIETKQMKATKAQDIAKEENDGKGEEKEDGREEREGGFGRFR